MPKRKTDINQEDLKQERTGSGHLEQKRTRSDGMVDVHETSDVVDYEDSSSHIHDNANEASSGDSKTAMTANEEQKTRITSALLNWCRSNIVASDEEASDIQERSEALAEVGMLLVFEHDKYPDASSLRSELHDIESIIGGDAVVTKFVNFLLSLQNQIKKAHAIAQSKENRKRPIPSIPATAPQAPSGSSIPMQFRPAAQPVIFHPQMWQQQQQMQHGYPAIRSSHQYSGQSFGRSRPQKVESEYEMKKNQILAECTEHLKALIEKASKARDPQEKAAILELIKKVKARMESLKSDQQVGTKT